MELKFVDTPGLLSWFSGKKPMRLVVSFERLGWDYGFGICDVFWAKGTCVEISLLYIKLSMLRRPDLWPDYTDKQLMRLLESLVSFERLRWDEASGIGEKGLRRNKPVGDAIGYVDGSK